MSAIYGMIDLKREPVPTVVGERFVEGYKECKIDRHEQKIRDNAMMGCELQYFTVGHEMKCFLLWMRSIT